MTMRKMLAVLAALAIMCAVLPLSAMFSAVAEDNVIENTNFDDGELHGWASSSTVSVEDGALKFECTKDWANVYKYANGMKANTDYLYTFKAKANMNKNMNIKINDNWGSDTAREIVDLTTEWQEFSVVVNSGACTGPILMFSANEPASTGLVYYIDDIVIAEHAGDEPETPDEPANDGNLIVNGDFETGDKTGWETWQSTTIEAAAAKDGAFGAHLVGNGSWGGLLNQTATVEAGKEYKLSFWINVNACGVNLQVKDGAGKAIDGTGGWFDANKKDTLVEWTFTATDDKVLINFCGSGSAPEDAYVDNFSLVCLTADEPEEPANDNLIVNGDFETGDASGWETWQSTTIEAAAAKDGAFGAHLVGNGSWGGMLNQTATVEAGKEYKLSFWINVNACGVNLQVKDGAGKAIDGTGGWFDANKKDHLVEWTFTATDDKVLINFCGSGSAPEDAYVDNFSLVCLTEGGDEPEIPAGPSDDGYIVNGDFETGDIKPWDNLWGSCPKAEVIEGGKDSAYALNVVSKQWCHVRQTGIAVEANTDYKISVWAKNANNMCLLVKDGNDTKDIANVGVTAGAEWTQFTVEFNSGDYTSIIFSLMGGEGTDQYGVFDNIVMEKVGGGETPDTPDEPDEPVIPDVPSDAPLNATFDTDEFDGIQSSSDISVADGVLQFNVTKDWGNIYTGFEVEANTDYQVTFRAKSKLAKNFWVKFHKADWTGDIVQKDAAMTKEWKEYSYTMNTGDNTYVYLLVQFAGYASEGEIAYFDYITVKKAGGDEPVDPPVSGGLLSEDFENGLPEDWALTTAGTSGVENGAMKIEGNAYAEILTSPVIALKKGVTYTISFDIKLINKGEINFQLKNCYEDNAGKGVNILLEYISDAKTDSWTTYTYTFKNEDLARDYASMLFVNHAGTDFYVDNIVVTSDEEPEVPDEPVVDSSIVNGGFENGSEGWELSSSASITEEDAHSGKASLKLEDPGMWSSAAVQNVPVKPNTEYVIEMWINRIKGTSPFNLYMMDAADNRNLEVVEGQNWFNTATSDWEKHTIVINTGAATEIVLKWSSEASKAGIMLVDDMTITEKNAPEPPASNGLVVNGDFETGDASGWETWQSTVVSEEAAKNGKYGINLIGNGGWGGLLNQTFAVENGETYIVTLWACVNSAGVNLQIKGADKVEGECDNTYLDANELSGWTKRTFTVVANSNEITLNFCGSGAGKAEDAYIDDIVVTKKGEVPPVEDTYPIKNAGFESGEMHSNTTPGGVTGAWYNVWGSCTYSFETPGHDKSQYALNFEGPGAWQQIRQDGIPVEPNTDYTLIAYVKNPLNINLVVKTADDSANIADFGVENDMSNQWIRQEIPFNSGEQTAVCVLIISNENGNGTALVDNVQIYKKGEEPAEPEPDAPATEGPMSLDSFGVAINRPASPEANLIQNGSFEDAEGGQWQSIISDTLYVVDDETAPEGNKSLFFNTSGVTENNKVIFYLDVEPNTDYVFSAWVKGAYISADNRFNATFGVTDWKDNFCVYPDAKFSNKTRQIVPTAWDNQWHLRSVQFNSGVNTKVGIGFAGAESQMWIDSIALYTVDNGIKYADPRQIATIRPTTLEENEGACSDEHNLIANATMDSAAAQEFWASAEGFKNGFISFPENEYEYGTSMKYVGDADSCYTHAIKWLELKPNTKYTFSVDVRVVKSGGGSLTLLDGKKRDCYDFLVIDFDQYGYGVDWVNITVEFDSTEFDRIGIAVVDGGGEALIDNMRLFESEYRIEGGIVDEYIDPPYDFGDPDEPDEPDEPDVPVEPDEPEEPACEHEYDNDDDVDCNICGGVRWVITDNGVLIMGTDGGVIIPAGAELIVEEKDRDSVSATLPEGFGVVQLLDISLMLNGEAIQSGNELYIVIPAPALGEYFTDMEVVYIDADGNFAPCEAYLNDDGSFTVVTNYLSYYAIIGVQVADLPEIEEPDTPDEPETPDEPGTPDEPETPDEPGKDEPETPDEPGKDEPETPDEPGKDEPETPDEPGKDEPETPDSPDTGVSVLGAVLAMALVPSSAAVAFKLRRKKEDEE